MQLNSKKITELTVQCKFLYLNNYHYTLGSSGEKSRSKDMKKKFFPIFKFVTASLLT